MPIMLEEAILSNCWASRVRGLCNSTSGEILGEDSSVWGDIWLGQLYIWGIWGEDSSVWGRYGIRTTQYGEIFG